MKENLKIRTPFESDKIEAQQLLFSIGNLWQGKFDELKIGATFFDCLFADGMSLTHGISEGGYFNNHANKEITLPELRELAQPKEYLNYKFELVATNQPEYGWILVPDGAEYFTEYSKLVSHLFWKTDENISYCHPMQTSEWARGDMNMAEYIEYWSGTKILWQRENKVETSKGRFLHQWAYEAFGRGEDVQFNIQRQEGWCDIDGDCWLNAFNDKDFEFRLKPQTIQIGSRTINKPISVKPEMGDIVYVANLTDIDLVTEQKWKNTVLHIHFFDLGLLHKSKEDALNHSKAFLETMK